MDRGLILKLEKVAVVVAFVVCVILTLLFVSRAFAKYYVVDGVYFGGVEMGGKEYELVEEDVVRVGEEYLKTTIPLVLNGEKKLVSLANLGVSLDEEKTFNRIYAVSYGRDLWWHLRTRFYGLMGKRVNVKPAFRIDRGKFVTTVGEVFPEIREAKDAKVVVDETGNVNVEKHELGFSVDFDQAYKDLGERVSVLMDDDIDLQGRVLRVDYTAEEAEGDAVIVRSFAGNSVSFKSENYGYEKILPFDLKWLSVRKGEIGFDQALLVSVIQSEIASEIDVVKSDLQVVSLPEGGVGHVNVQGEIVDGKRVDVAATYDGMIADFKARDFVVEVVVEETKGDVVNRTGSDLGDLNFLARGRSNFAGSTAGRAFNVGKGLGEKMNNILIAPGAEFDFNSFLGPVTFSAGWKEALAIFNGKDLEPVPGGGLCQVSTTVYRAALNAGLEITEQRNHSLYVKYYKAYGNGLDATIYPGQQNLKFVNNTGNYIFLRSWVDGNEAYVDFYGTDDGRKIELVGPYYYNTVPEDLKSEISLKHNEIAWVYKVIFADGSTKQEVLRSAYLNAISR